MTPDSTVPSDTDRLAEIRRRIKAATETEGRSIGAIQNGKKELRQNAAADLTYLLDEIATLQGRLDTAEGRLSKVRAALVQTAVELYQFWQFAAEKEGDGFGWTPEITVREEGKFRGAAWSLQYFLVTLGEADEEDDEAGAAYEVIEAARAALGLSEGDTDA
ncbi:hypothetical protein [Glycomyces sp. NPDC021274]|uniref:hypothetical protein n=1 Tax=Glycomyces sp. NPDC021274 TaxID=3155120 RepID=UPI0033C6C6BC